MGEGLRMSDFKVVADLGRGSFGQVSKVLYKNDVKPYVLKTIFLPLLASQRQQHALSEVSILRQVNHPHIVRYFGSFIEDRALHIVMECVEGGDLAKVIRKQKEHQRLFPEAWLWKVAYELCLAVQHLHSLNIIHRDLKPRNVLITRKGRIKVGDFGISRLVSSSAVLKLSNVGTPLFQAPELILEEPYDFKVDIWGVGCILYSLAQLDPPFNGANLVTLGRHIVEEAPRPLPFAYSGKFLDFVSALITKKAASRPSIVQAIELIPSTVKTGYAAPRYFPASLRIAASASLPSLPKPRFPPLTHRPNIHSVSSGFPLRTNDSRRDAISQEIEENERRPKKKAQTIKLVGRLRDCAPLDFARKVTIRDLVSM